MSCPNVSELQVSELQASELQASELQVSELQVLDRPMTSDICEEIQVSIRKGDRQKRYISAVVAIPHSVERVWQVVTNYEQLADFIPNLTKSQPLSTSSSGIQLELVGSCRVLNLHFSGRVVLDMIEQFPDKIDFYMTQGDLHAYSGQWRLEQVSKQNKSETLLHYSAEVVPKLTLPIALLERQLRQDLPINLLAIRERLNTLFGTT